MLSDAILQLCRAEVATAIDNLFSMRKVMMNDGRDFQERENG